MDTISHCTKNNPWKLQGRSAVGVLLILVALSLLGWIYLTQASHVATTSRRVQKLEREKARLQQENLDLMAHVAEFESVSRLAARAEELGFVMASTQDAEFLVISDLVLPQTQVAGAETSVDRFLDSVASQFTAWTQEGLR